MGASFTWLLTNDNPPYSRTTVGHPAQAPRDRMLLCPLSKAGPTYTRFGQGICVGCLIRLVRVPDELRYSLHPVTTSSSLQKKHCHRRPPAPSARERTASPQ